jgi:hypothetical protein
MTGRWKRNVVLVLTIAGAALCATLFAVREPVLLAIGDYLIVRDELRPADVIHVLTGRDYRTDYSIQVYQ